MDPYFNSVEELLSRIRVSDRQKIQGPVELALMEFAVSLESGTGKKLSELRTTHAEDTRLKIAETLYVKAILVRDLPTLLAGSSTNAEEVWNEESSTRDRTSETYDVLMSKADSMIYMVSQEIQGDVESSSYAAVLGSDDPEDRKDVFGSIELTRDLF